MQVSDLAEDQTTQQETFSICLVCANIGNAQALFPPVGVGASRQGQAVSMPKAVAEASKKAEADPTAGDKHHAGSQIVQSARPGIEAELQPQLSQPGGTEHHAEAQACANADAEASTHDAQAATHNAHTSQVCFSLCWKPHTSQRCAHTHMLRLQSQVPALVLTFAYIADQKQQHTLMRSHEQVIAHM